MADSNSVTAALATLGTNGWAVAAPPSNYSGAVSGGGIPNIVTRRFTPGSARVREFMSPSVIFPVAMAAPPTVTCVSASTITSPKIWPVRPPLLPSNVFGGYVRITGTAGIPSFTASQVTNNKALSADVAIGSTTILLAGSVSPGTYFIQPYWTFGMIADAYRSAEYVTITSVTGSGPYTANLSAPTTKAHRSNDQCVTTTTITPGYSQGGGVNTMQCFYGTVQGTIKFDVVTDAPTIEFIGAAGGSLDYRIWVDGVPATAAFVTVANPNGNNAATVLSVAFGSRVFRRVTMEASGQVVGAIYTGQTDSLLDPGEPNCRALFVSDSFGGSPDGHETYACRVLGIEGCFIAGLGGTGYIADNQANLAGNPGNLINRINEILAPNFDYVFLNLGYNDSPSTPLQATITACLTQISAGLKTGGKLIVTGPWAALNSTNTNKTPVDALITTVCAQFGLPNNSCLSPTPWVYGTGKSGSPAGNGNSDFMMASDGSHYTDTGQIHAGYRLGKSLLPYL